MPRSADFLDPVGEAGPRRARDVVEDAGADGRDVGGALDGFEEEDGHLLAGDGVPGQIVRTAAAAGDLERRELLDPGVERSARARHVGEDGPVHGGGMCAAPNFDFRRKTAICARVTGSVGSSRRRRSRP